MWCGVVWFGVVWFGVVVKITNIKIIFLFSYYINRVFSCNFEKKKEHGILV